MTATAYYSESLVPVSLMTDPEYLRDFEAYLLAVMDAHGYRVLSPVVITAMEDEAVTPPKGLGIIRASVTVSEFDIDVPMSSGDTT